MSDAQQVMTFEVILSFDPALLNGRGARASYCLTDFYGTELLRGTMPVRTGEGLLPQTVISVDRETARRIYFAGRFCVSARVSDSGGRLLAGADRYGRPPFV